jgi:hypothetical protein
MEDDVLRETLGLLDASSRDVLRRAARSEQRERDELAARLMREPDGQRTADLIDEMSIMAEARRQMVRALGELEPTA